MSVISALLSLVDGDRSGALGHLDGARREQPDALLPQALWTYLASDTSTEVYVAPEAFERFINGGTNPALYEATIEALHSVYAQYWPTSVLDIGCGDGRVAHAAIDVPGNRVKQLDLVEPSDALLGVAMARTMGDSIDVVGHQCDAKAFVATDRADRWWDLTQSTFAMHTMAPEERGPVLAELAVRTDRVVLVEFDVPDFADHSVEHATYAAQRYEIGLREYADDGVVQQGFLMPVLAGQFDRSQMRHTHEQSADRWALELQRAGLDEIAIGTVLEYWWAAAVVIVATRPRR
jgi:SAM-dependent methyltransferase